MQFWHALLLLWTATILVVPSLHLAIPALLSFAGLFLSRRAIEQSPIREPGLRASWHLMIAGFVAFALSGFLLNLYHGDADPGAYERLLPFVLLPAMAWTIRAGAWTPQSWLAAVAVAALLSGAYATYQFLTLGGIRAEGATGNAIKFGNGAVLLATICLFAAQFYPFQKNSLIWRMGLVASSIVATFASLLSGSKGGWLALILIALISGYAFFQKGSRLTRSAFVGSILVLVVAASFLAPSIVRDRIVNGVDGAVHWFQSGGEITESSVSLRFKLWELGYDIFKENPIFGAGAEGKAVRWAELVAADPAAQIIGVHKSAHNDFIEVLSEGGLVAAVGLAFTYIGVWLAFWRWRNHPDPVILALARMGLALVPIYLVFGLTVSVSGINFFRSIFIGYAVTILSLITVHLSKSATFE